VAAARDLATPRASLAAAPGQAADLEADRGRIRARAASAARGRAAAEASLDIQPRSARSAREAAAAQFDRELRRAAEAHAIAERSIREETARTDEALRAGHAQELAKIRDAVRGTSAADIAAAEARAEERLGDLTKQLKDATTREGQARADLHAELELREAAERRIQDLEPLVARTRESLDLERRERLRQEGETAVKLETLEERIAARDADVTAASHELEGLREEVVALEREIAAMRSELAGARTRVENESAMARAAHEELEKNRQLITRARALLADLVDGKDRAGKA
jgi:chromosome segregation ATPase